MFQLRCLNSPPLAARASRSMTLAPHGRACYSTSSSLPLPVQGHPSLYLHPTSTPDRYSLSFLKFPPLSENSPTILGHNAGRNITPRTFQENPEWRLLLHEILKHTCWADESLRTQAVNRDEGYLHILDERNLPALNRAGEPEDIIASVLCKNGRLVEGQYEEGQAYRIVTANGPPQLSQGLLESVVQGLKVAHSVEEEIAKATDAAPVG